MSDFLRRRLEQDIEKKIKTTMIGALASFEKRFGKLWGHDKSKEEELTPQEHRFLQIWLEVREEILDRGNAQIASSGREIRKYNVNGNRYNYKFEMRREDG
jgi:hypothetical protein